MIADDAIVLVTRIFEAEGVGHIAALATARALVAAERDGQRGHGLSRVSSYVEQVRVGKINPNAMPSSKEVSDAAVIVDADHGFAYPAIDIAIDEVARLARKSKIAIAAIRRSHHFGQAGSHVERLAERGLVAFLYGNSPKAMAFWGGTSPMMGTNPIAFAAPMSGNDALVIDLALSVSARGKIMAAAKADEPIPEGWALDADGQPTTDANEALSGSMLPLGGAKGAALALMVEVLAGAVTGSHFGFEASSFLNAEGPPPNVGCLLIAFDPEAISGGDYSARIDVLAEAIQDEPGVRLPGSRRFENRRCVADTGLEIPPKLFDELTALSASANT